MNIYKNLKTSLTAIAAGFMLWSCSGDEGKPRYVAAMIDGEEKWSILDTETGEILCQNDFTNAPSQVKDGLFTVKNRKGYYECYDISDPKKPLNDDRFTQLGLFTDGVAFAVKEGKPISIINKDFEIVKTLSDKISQVCDFTDGLAAFCEDGKWGFMDTDGETVIPAKYDNVMLFREGRTFALLNDRILLLDKKGEVVSSMKADKYEFISGFTFTDGYCPLLKDNRKVVFINTDGEEVYTSSRMEKGYCYEAHDGKTVYTDGESYGIMTLDGEILVRAKYSSLAYASPDRYIAVKDNEEGVIDSMGEIVIPFDNEVITQLSSKPGHYFVFNKKSWTLTDEKGEEIGDESFADFGSYPVTYFFNEKATADATDEEIEAYSDYDYDDPQEADSSIF